jgi:hypothetical protein
MIFAAFGLFMGYLLPTENVMQVLSIVLVLLAFAGGLFIPISRGTAFDHFAQFTPMSGINYLGRAGLGGTSFSWIWIVNALAWLVIFVRGRHLTIPPRHRPGVNRGSEPGEPKLSVPNWCPMHNQSNAA